MTIVDRKPVDVRRFLEVHDLDGFLGMPHCLSPPADGSPGGSMTLNAPPCILSQSECKWLAEICGWEHTVPSTPPADLKKEMLQMADPEMNEAPQPPSTVMPTRSYSIVRSGTSHPRPHVQKHHFTTHVELLSASNCNA